MYLYQRNESAITRESLEYKKKVQALYIFYKIFMKNYLLIGKSTNGNWPFCPFQR